MQIDQTHSALIMVDIQNDFCPNGGLAVPAGDEIVSLANDLQHHFKTIIATQDWHPQDHKSFASNHPGGKVGKMINLNGISQVLWPIHCVQNTYGAEFHPDLNLQKVSKIIHKGSDPDIDSYSAFFDNAHLRSTGLGDFLKERGLTTVYLLGLATDYCVKYSCLDAIHLGFEVYLIEDGCRGIELNPGDIKKTLDDLQTAGVKIITSKDILA